MTSAAAAAQRTPAGVLESLRATPPAARAVLAGVFVNKLGAFLQVFVVLYLTHRGYSAVAAGGALGAYAAGSIGGLLVGGSLSDRLGARRTIAGSMAVSAGLILCVLYAPAYALIIAAVALFGAVGQAYRPASGALLSELTPPERQVMVFAFYRLALNLGTTAAPLIGAALVAVSYRLLFWGEAVAALAYTAIALAALPRGSRSARPAVTRERPAARAARVSYTAVLADRRYVVFLAAMLLNGLVYVQYLATLPLAVRHAGYGTALYGGCVAVNGAIVITCELLVTKVVQRWPARLAAAVGLALLGVGVSLYAAPVGVAVFLLATVVWSLGEIVGGPTMFAYPAQAGSAALRGRYIGAAHAMFGLGSAIGPVLGVWAWTVMGRPFWLVCGALSVVAVATVCAGLRHSEPSPIPEPSPCPTASAPSKRTQLKRTQLKRTQLKRTQLKRTDPPARRQLRHQEGATAMQTYAVIVDPFGTGQEYGPTFQARGVTPVAVLTRADVPSSYAASWFPANYEHIHVFDGDLAKLAATVKEYEPICVIPGSEPGVELAEALCAEVLPGKGNVPELAAARRDKWEMAQALMRAGIPHLRQFCSADPDAIAAWLDESGLAGQRLVVKPPKSVGTDEVHVVPAGQDWRPAFDRIIGKENKAGVRNEAVLVEEFCDGTEYIVDTYSVDGQHGLVDVCRYTKRQRDDRIGIYDRVYFLPPHHPDVPVLRDYAMRVVEAVGIRNGCGHNEIMLAEDGPRLIEVAARLAGGGHQGVTMLATGDNHVQRTVRHHLDGAFRPDFDWQQYVCAAFLSAPRPGVFRNGDVFDAARDYPTYSSEKFFFGTGDVVPATDDIFTPLGWVILADPDEAAVERDYARLKELERQVVIDPA